MPPRRRSHWPVRLHEVRPHIPQVRVPELRPRSRASPLKTSLLYHGQNLRIDGRPHDHSALLVDSRAPRDLSWSREENISTKYDKNRLSLCARRARTPKPAPLHRDSGVFRRREVINLFLRPLVPKTRAWHPHRPARWKPRTPGPRIGCHWSR